MARDRPACGRDQPPEDAEECRHPGAQLHDAGHFPPLGDFRGDSLQLAREASKVDADIIVQAGVHFMAETSKILAPEKTVLIPDTRAGCSLAASITGAMCA